MKTIFVGGSRYDQIAQSASVGEVMGRGHPPFHWGSLMAFVGLWKVHSRGDYWENFNYCGCIAIGHTDIANYSGGTIIALVLW